MDILKKYIIGMIHLKSLPSSVNSSLSMDEIFEHAKFDLKALENGGIDAAIVENMFDEPFTTKQSLSSIVSFTNLFTRIKSISNIPLGVNLQYTNDSEEMLIATLCGAEFIRVENYVENRIGYFGELIPNYEKILRAKKNMNSSVKVFSDVSVKHTFPKFPQQDLQYSIESSIMAKADAIILTGIETGKAPSIKDAKLFGNYSNDVPIIIGSGVTKDNIKEFFKYANGVIVGSSIKINGDVKQSVDINRVSEIVMAAKS